MRDLDPEEYANINYVRDRFFEIAWLFNFQLTEPSPLELLATLEAKSRRYDLKRNLCFQGQGR